MKHRFRCEYRSGFNRNLRSCLLGGTLGSEFTMGDDYLLHQLMNRGDFQRQSYAFDPEMYNILVQLKKMTSTGWHHSRIRKQHINFC